MNKQKIISLAFFVVTFAPTVNAQQITVSNGLPADRRDELIVISRKLVTSKLTTLKESEYIRLSDAQGKDQILQFDDLDRDGKWDEVVFLCNFKPLENAVFHIRAVKKVAKKTGLNRAHVRQRRKNADDKFGVQLLIDSVPRGQLSTDFSKHALPPLLTEGPAWENDKVGFRIYMDVRNIKDIWGKLTPNMVLDTVGTDPNVIYHHLDSWGMDILAVGKSLGAGSLALRLQQQNGIDTLVRLGGKNMGEIRYQQIADGPVRAVFKLIYPQWNVLPYLAPTHLEEEISIWGGQYFYQSKVTLTHAPDAASLVSGIVNLKSKTSYLFKDAQATALYTYDVQSENNDALGLAIMTTNKVKTTGVTPNECSDVLNTYTIDFLLSGNEPIVTRFYASWSLSDKRFKDLAGYKKYIKEELSKQNNPIIIQ
ncbi:DUF4861 domain-containing protein [Pedobacter frigidisoli]|uniref:DUF4861 domain-containing protein n=1 Tax=Pedobacter frigidisoli TaxID=2530455 RepID=UPI00292E6B06|nr:DUF4861 domain-containing protein [Pedobacter frigidisoli]